MHQRSQRHNKWRVPYRIENYQSYDIRNMASVRFRDRSLSLSLTVCFLFNAKTIARICYAVGYRSLFLISLRQCHFSGDRYYTPSPTRKVRKICFQVTFPRGDSDTEPLAVGDDISDLCLGRRNRTEIKSRVKIGRLSPFLVRSYLSWLSPHSHLGESPKESVNWNRSFPFS